MMFAVPGWLVASEALKTQTSRLSNSAVTPSLPSTCSGAEVACKTSKKRKRSNGISRAPEVNSANLSELWKTIIEKKSTLVGLQKTKKHSKKRPKVGEMLDGRSPANSESAIGNKGSLKAKGNLGNPKNGKQVFEAPLRASNDYTSNNAMPLETPSAVDPIPNLTPLQHSMRQKLTSARFRHLNQTLYTNSSAHSLALFQESPEMFQEYHEGFRRQVEVWPENPLNAFMAQIKRRGMERSGERTKIKSFMNDKEGRQGRMASPLPRTNGLCSIADLGCGDGGLAKGLEGVKRILKVQVFSYDLQSSGPLVTQADIADLPLKDGSIDVAIFCLALMGTNWIDFIEEAFRILRWKGELWIAEIRSRFERVRGQTKRVDYSVGNKRKSMDSNTKTSETAADDSALLFEVDGHVDHREKTDVSAFVEVLRKRGFVLQDDEAIDLSNKMFTRMQFVKGQTPVKGKCVPLPIGMAATWKKKPKGMFLDKEVTPFSSEAAVLKPCIYKLR